MVLVDEKIAKTIKVGEHATTFGGGPVVCAAGKATLEIILAEGFLSELQKNADYLRTELEKNFEVFGAGFLLGIKTDKIGKDLVKKCLENNLIIGTSMEPNIIRIMPPINISREEIDQFLEIFTRQAKS